MKINMEIDGEINMNIDVKIDVTLSISIIHLLSNSAILRDEKYLPCPNSISS